MTDWTPEDLETAKRRNPDFAAVNPGLKTHHFRDVTKMIAHGVAQGSARKQPEKELASAFDELATLRGWTWCGFRPARQKIDGAEQYRTPIIGQKGLPDRILARNGVVLLVEFKSGDGQLSEGQKIWGDALKGFAGYYVVRPSSWNFVEGLLA